MTPRILVVDDRPDVRLALCFMLEAMGYAVREAGDGDAALRSLAEQPQDLVITDLSMPRSDGWSLIKRLRDQLVKIVVLSGSASVIELAQARESGADAVLTKPASRETLQRTIRQVLGGTARRNNN